MTGSHVAFVSAIRKHDVKYYLFRYLSFFTHLICKLKKISFTYNLLVFTSQSEHVLGE